MTATGDTIAAIQALIQQLQNSAGAANAAAGQAGNGRTVAAALGHTRSVAAFSAVQQNVGEIHRTIGALVGKAQEAIAQTKAIEGG
jgi:hypothetical protein